MLSRKSTDRKNKFEPCSEVCYLHLVKPKSSCEDKEKNDVKDSLKDSSRATPPRTEPNGKRRKLANGGSNSHDHSEESNNGDDIDIKFPPFSISTTLEWTGA